MLAEPFTNKPFKILSRARPRRIAFLVDPTNCPPELLDALFDSNYGIWGGRYNPIIPVASGEISDNYWKLLHFTDPDIIYSYCEISGDIIRRLDHELCPLKILKHRGMPPEEEHPNFSPSICYEQVASTALIPIVLQKEKLSFIKPKLLTSAVDKDWQGHRFILRNFGILDEGMAFKPYSESQEKITINSDWTHERCFEELANDINPIIFPFQASEAYAEFPESDNSYQGDYCLVIGDHVQDWIYYWNWIFNLNASTRSRWNALCISLERIKSQSFRDSLRKFLRKFAYRKGNSAALIELVSSSVPLADLEQIKMELSPGLDANIKIEKTVPNDIPPISFEHRSFPEFYQAGMYLFEKNRTTYQQATSRKCLLATPASTISLNRGIWMMDLRIEHVAELPFYINEELWWQLPRQREIAQLFLRNLQSRISEDHSISAEINAKGVFELSIPNESSVILTALGASSRFLWGEYFKQERKEPPYNYIVPSDKGEYLNGVVSLFGGLQNAGSFFKSSFWRSIVENLSHRDPSAEEMTIINIKNRLRKKKEILRGYSEAPEDTIDLLSHEVLKLARDQNMSEIDISFAELEDKFQEQREAFIKMNPDYRKDLTDEGIRADRAEATKYLSQSFQAITNSGIFRQGVRLRCNNCGSKFWQVVDDVRQENMCPGCGGVASLPVKATWRFSLNSLVRNAVAFHGCVPVILCVHHLRSIPTKHGFICSPGLTLYKSFEDKRPSSEIDLACIIDGSLVIGEVKTNCNEFTPEKLKELADHARAFDATAVILGCFQDPNNKMEQKKSDLGVMLKDAHCQVWTYIPSNHVFEPTPNS